jgi:hypothetical protein
MHKFWRKAIAVLAALAAAPLVVWCGMIVFSLHGGRHWLAASSFIEKFITLTGALPLDTTGTDKSLAIALIWGGIGIALVVAIIVACLLLWISSKSRFGIVLSIAIFISAGIGYGWLVWDEPLLPRVDPAQLLPIAGVHRTPREFVLEATNDPKFGHAKDWPTSWIVWGKDELSPEWLHAHAAEISAHWEQLAPVRDWVRRVNNYEGFDDYCDSFGSPIPAFKPLRAFGYTSHQMALLLASKGHADEAVPILVDSMVLGRKLGDGSRTLVTLMVGCVIEKDAIGTLEVMANHSALSADSRHRLEALLRSPTNEWDNFDRVLLNEAACMRNWILSDDFARAITQLRGRDIVMRPLLLLGFNRNATSNLYQREMATSAQFAKSSNIAALQQWEQAHAGQIEKGRWHIKNVVGQSLVDEVIHPDLTKITYTLQHLREERANLVATLEK